MAQLIVASAPRQDVGRQIVRINKGHRGKEIARYAVVRVRCHETKRSMLALLLGHDCTGKIFMPFDVREELSVAKGKIYNFDVEPVGRWRTLCWWLSTKDPAVWLPAWLAIGSLMLGVISLVSGVWSLCMAQE